MQANDVRQGATITMNGELYIVTDFRYHSPGNKRAFVQLTIRSLRTGKIAQHKFSSTEDVEEASLDHKQCQFLYSNKEGFNFMDLEDFHTFVIGEAQMGNQKYYLKENDEVSIAFYEGNPVELELPPHVFLKITEAPPWVKGDSVSNNVKPATTETGLKIQVPIFLKEGEVVKVDTRTGEYLGRQ